MIDYKRLIKKRSVRLAILRFLSFIPDREMLQLQYRIKTGRKLNLKDPKRYTEKLQWYKLYYKNPLMIQCVDKYDVREYIIQKGLEEILIPNYGVYDSVEQIDWNALPESFVIKDTLGGGGTSVIFIRNKEGIDKEIINTIQSWTEINPRCKSGGREWPYYSGRKHRILIDKYIDSCEAGELIDYKFICYHGHCEYIYIAMDRELGNGAKFGIYDSSLRKINAVRLDERPLEKEINKPRNFEKMIKIAEILSKDFPQARIDLYNNNGLILFGEITFYDGSGYTTFQPDSFDYQLGEKFRLENINDQFLEK